MLARGGGRKTSKAPRKADITTMSDEIIQID